MNDDSVTLRDIKDWKRPLTIDGNDRAFSQAIWVPVDPANVPIIVDRTGIGAAYEPVRE